MAVDSWVGGDVACNSGGNYRNGQRIYSETKACDMPHD
jgi:hypothetical protein